MNEVYIVAAKRTAIGSFLGGLSSLSAPKLGAEAIKAALSQSNIKPEDVDECIMGNVLTAGIGQAPARQAAIYAGLPESVPCMTINKVCGSGLKSVMLGAQSIMTEDSHVVVAGGQENMSQTPHILQNTRNGYKLGDQKLIDSLVHDGLWDPYNNFHMGTAAESCVKEYSFTREEQDEFAVESYKRAQAAQSNGAFGSEIAAIEIKTRKGSTVIDKDEEPEKANFDKFSKLRPAFDKEGTITAANASSLNDGASALILASKKKVDELGLKPLAKIVGYATHAQAPKWFTTAPVEAMKKCLKKTSKQASDIDLWEINEAFSNVTMAAMKDLSIPHENVNVNGGAVSLGHPIGASGARILTTLLYALESKNKSTGMASLCIGGGEAVAVMVERV